MYDVATLTATMMIEMLNPWFRDIFTSHVAAHLIIEKRLLEKFRELNGKDRNAVLAELDEWASEYEG